MIFKNKSGISAELVEKVRHNKVLVRFLDGTLYEDFYRLEHLIAGNFYNPMSKTIADFGFIGVRKQPRDKEYQRIKGVWLNMVKRCYDMDNVGYPCYGGAGVTVSDEWANFQNFLSWYRGTCKHTNFQMDKDLLSGGVKQYSKETCCFLPKEINLALIRNPKEFKVPTKRRRVRSGAVDGKRESFGFLEPEESVILYRSIKEERIKSLATEWRDFLSEEVYLKLMEWQYI